MRDSRLTSLGDGGLESRSGDSGRAGEIVYGNRHRNRIDSSDDRAVPRLAAVLRRGNRPERGERIADAPRRALGRRGRAMIDVTDRPRLHANRKGKREVEQNDDTPYQR